MISVVVPAYNVEKYVSKCIKSICDQTYKDLEIIIVDDGSVDDTLEICRGLAREDTRIAIIHQDNKGVVSARRTGIDAANGELIGFVDGDDWIEPEMFEHMFFNIGDADLISVGSFWEESKGRIKKRRDGFEAGEYDEDSIGMIAGKMLYDDETTLAELYTPWMWNKMYRTNKLRQVYSRISNELDFAEDVVFNCRYLLESKRVVLSDEYYYHYVYREISSIHKKDIDRLGRVDRAYRALYDVFSCFSGDESLMRQLQKWVQLKCNYAINERMGFYNDIRFLMYLVDPAPYAGKKLVIYGAGRVGKDVYYQFEKLGYNVQAWADRDCTNLNGNGYNIIPPEEISEYEYDIILIAIEDEGLASRIKEDLTSKGINPDNIEIARLIKMY